MTTASDIVQVTISTTPQTVSRAGFGTGLFLTRTTGVIPLNEGVRFYANLAAVTADWSGDDVEDAATAYFGQNPAPTQFAVGERYLTAQAGFNLGSSANVISVPATWAAITDGEFNISIDGVNNDITVVDFTGDTTMDNVAATIEAKIQAIGAGGFTGALCVWTGTQFKITSGTTGASSTVSYVTSISVAVGTDISGMMDMDNGEGTLQTGIDAETDITDALNRLAAKSSDWYGLFLNITERDSSESEDAAAWAETQIKQLWIVSNNPDATNSGISTDIGSVLNALNYRRTWVQWSSQPTEYPEIAAFAKAAIVQFSNGTNTTITMKFQQITGITEEVLTTAQAGILSGKGYNMFTTVGSVGIIQEGNMVAGLGTWQDTIHGVDWLTNAIETDVFNRLLTAGTKIAYTDEGVEAIVQVLKADLEEGVTNGLIARSGTTTSGAFLANGYTIAAGKVADVAVATKQLREAPPIVFTAIGAGAIHFVQITGTFEG